MDHPRRILFISSEYGEPGTSKDSVRELVHALAARGHSVHVIVPSWMKPGPTKPLAYSDGERVEVLRLPRFEPRGFGRLLGRIVKWSFASLRWRGAVRRWLRGRQIDLLFAYSPAVIAGSIIHWAFRRFKPVGYFYTVDFFPYHHRSIGLVPDGPLFRIALARETQLIRLFDVIGCMSEANVRYLQDHYALRDSQRPRILRLAISRRPTPRIDVAAVRAANGLPPDRPVVIFGGQITEGRGIAEIVGAARLAHQRQSDLFFLLIGAGRLVHLIQDYVAEGFGNLLLLEPRPRDAYLELATAADMGLVVTVPQVDVPTFPSKTLDYLQAGLPVVAAVEASTDYAAFIEGEGFGTALAAGDPRGLYERLEEIAADPARRARMKQAGQRALDTVFNIDTMAGSIVAQSFDRETGAMAGPVEQSQ